MPIFSEAEMRRRTRIIAEALTQRDIPAAFLHSADNAYYVSGVPLLSAWGRPLVALVGGSRAPVVIGAMLEQENMERYGVVGEIRTYADAENVWLATLDLAADVIRTSWPGAKRIGVERAILPIQIAEALESKLGVQLLDVSHVLAEARIIKSAEEIKLLRIGAQVARIGADAFVNAISAGVTELAVAADAVAAMDAAIAGLYPEAATSSYAYCHFGDHTMTPHLHPTGRRLQPGDVFALNVFPVIWGYCMELERTYVFGDLTERQRQVLAAVDESFRLGKQLLQPGKLLSELHDECMAVLAREGFEKYVRHGTGHAHGIMIGAAGREEFGELRGYNSRKALPGMLNSIEPGVYIPGEGGFRHSDVMLVTQQGNECLTEFPTEIAF